LAQQELNARRTAAIGNNPGNRPDNNNPGNRPDNGGGDRGGNGDRDRGGGDLPSIGGDRSDGGDRGGNGDRNRGGGDAPVAAAPAPSYSAPAPSYSAPRYSSQPSAVAKDEPVCVQGTWAVQDNQRVYVCLSWHFRGQIYTPDQMEVVIAQLGLPRPALMGG
jgi:hypothetical protein